MAAINAIAEGAEYPLLVDMALTQSLSRQAPSVFIIPCSTSRRIALLGSSPVDRTLAKWSLGVQNLPCPTRFFTSKLEAIRWLLRPRYLGTVDAQGQIVRCAHTEEPQGVRNRWA